MHQWLPTSNNALLTCRSMLLAVLLWAALGLSPAHATPAAQSDPAQQCAEGSKLFFDGKREQALPLLEAGFSARATANFDPQALGVCALQLGFLREQAGKRSEAQTAYQVALESFRAGTSSDGESLALIGLGRLSQQGGQNDEALRLFEQARDTQRGAGDRAGEATTLGNIGALYVQQSRYNDALAQFQQALHIQRDLGDKRGEAVALNNLALVYQNQGRYAEAQQTYGQILPIFRELNDTENEATALGNLGTVLLRLGQYENARATVEQALALVRANQDRASEATQLNNLGTVLEAQARNSAALDRFGQALAIFQEIDDRSNQATTLNNIGAVQQSQGRFEAARETYTRALAIYQALTNRAGEGTARNNLGYLDAAQGRFASAITEYQQALAIAQAVGDRSLEGDVLNNMGAVSAAQSRYALALEQYAQALARYRETGKLAGESSALSNIGSVYEDQNRLDEALTQFQQALALAQSIADPARQGTISNNIGLIFQQQSRYDDAERQYQQALHIARTSGDRVAQSTALNNIGSNAIAQNRYAEAQASMQQALATAHAAGDRSNEATALNNLGDLQRLQNNLDSALENFQQALAIEQGLGDRVGMVVTLNNIAHVRQLQNRNAEATEAIIHAMDVLDDVRAEAGSEQGRAQFSANYAYVYERAMFLYQKQGHTADAFRAAERGRARAFLDSLATGTITLSDQSANALLDREREAYAARQGAREVLAQAQAATPTDLTLLTDLQTQLATSEREYTAVQSEIDNRSDQLATLVSGRKDAVLTLEQTQTRLPPDTTMVAYFVGEPDSLAFVITAHSAKAIRLPLGRSTLEKLVKTLIAFDDRYSAVPPESEQLYGELIAPLKADLQTSRLVIVPHGVLHYLPFAALSNGTRFLGDDYSMSALPSASVLPFIEPGTAGGIPLILGNPDGTLPSAANEARAVATLLDAQPLLRGAATKAALDSQAPHAGLIHLATHGVYNPQTPLDSYIQLAPTPTSADSKLTVSQIYGLRLPRATLVVLSACETNIGALSQGDEVVGMARAFMYAGAPSVIASLWDVQDDATKLLMERFYQYLAAGESKAAALGKAQRDVRTYKDSGKQPYASPYYWAGFVLSGADNPIVAPWWQFSDVPWWTTALLAIAIAALGAWRVWRRARASMQKFQHKLKSISSTGSA
ncbi:MAG: tetratricopeptide repeat protein [Roseiflexaceae bacterium]|nr:tetratricopeptide repeat protein [Roseiflexaceae bacterium]